MTPEQPPIDLQLQEQIRQAKRMSPEERVVEGLRLSDLALQVMADAIGTEYPQASGEEIHRLVGRRLERIRQLERLR